MKPAAAIRKSFSESLGEMIPVDRLFDGVPDIVFFVKDLRGRYMAANDTLAKRCGLGGKDEAIGRTAEELFPTPLGSGFLLQDQEILDGSPAISDRLELHLYPGGRQGWCLTYKEPVRGKNGGIVAICGISRDLHTPSSDDDKFTSLSGAIDHIHRHFDEPLRLPALAQIAGISVYQFDQRIRSLFHLTGGQYIVKIRIDAACKRLLHTTDPVAQIALDCGYSDQSAFTRQFKQVVGISPLAYRKKLSEH